MVQLPFVNTYIKYFQYLATRHPLLRHRNEVGSKTFDVVLQRDIKELAIARTDINAAADFILIAVVPTKDTQPLEDGHAKNYYTGGFFVFKKYSPKVNKKDDWWAALYETEVIATQILQRMVFDSQNKHPLFHRQADSYEQLNPRFSERTLGDDWHGFLVTFNIRNILPNCPLPCAWLDGGNGGTTPHDFTTVTI
jgi:hypothetical protein